MQNTVDVIIPVCKAQNRLQQLLNKLAVQDYPVHQVILVETQEGAENRKQIVLPDTLSVCEKIVEDTKDKAILWNVGIAASEAEFLLFLEEDAIPCDDRLIRMIQNGFKDEKVVAVYGRQIPESDLSELEKGMQTYQYSSAARRQSISNVAKDGVKAFFCSNVCAAYRRQAFLDYGTFDANCITQSENIWVANMIYLGWKVLYQANARVEYSCPLKLPQVFSQMFDVGVAQKRNSQAFGTELSILCEDNETPYLIQLQGMQRIIRKQVVFTNQYLLKKHAFKEIPKLFGMTFLMLMGAFVGKRYHRFPVWLCRICSQKKEYWK